MEYVEIFGENAAHLPISQAHRRIYLLYSKFSVSNAQKTTWWLTRRVNY